MIFKEVGEREHMYMWHKNIRVDSLKPKKRTKYRLARDMQKGKQYRCELEENKYNGIRIGKYHNETSMLYIKLISEKLRNSCQFC